MITDAEIAGMKAEIENLRARNIELQQKLEWLMEQFRLAKHQQFCPSSEQTPPEQLSLFDEAEALADPSLPEPEIKEVKAYCRRKAGQVGLDRLPDDLPAEEIVHELPPEKQSCPDCGNPLHAMGREER